MPPGIVEFGSRLYDLHILENLSNVMSSLLTIAAFIALINKTSRKWIIGKLSTHDKTQAEEQRQDKQDERLDCLETRVNEIIKMQQATAVGIRTMLHDRLYQAINYNLCRGWTTLDDFDNITHLYDAYVSLDGNGTGKELYERVKKLPMKGDKN